MSLLGELRQYRKDYVEIPQSEQIRAREIVEEIKREFQQYNSGSPYNFGQIFHQGSSYEGLKVIKADEFDLLVPLNLNNHDWKITPSSQRGTSGYYMITKQHASSVATFDNFTEQGGLIPAKVRQNMQSVVQRAVNSMGGRHFSVDLGHTGPAITIHVVYDYGKELSIDIVPCLQLNGRRFYAKSPPDSLRNTTSNVYDRMWRESFSNKEMERINRMDGMNECRRDCLKILKTIQKRRGISQIGMLSSYHLKTCLLHLNHDRPRLTWHQDDMADRFKDLVNTLMEFLENRNMPNFFCRSVNLFDRYDTDSLKNILGWLRKATRDDKSIIDHLLHERDFVKPTPDNFQIEVKNQNGKTKTYSNMQRSTKVKQLKTKIYENEGIPTDQQRLQYQSKTLQDDRTLGYYGIQQGSTLYLLGGLRGG
ncbi:cyclic GMP-AMP synthase-like isoform X3 [Anneissia japonica]|uniref:cyclic GMP-AMP synthase-like isoform X3 n=1 Tax=Anneissia japonica TaxID=1529436 RepID=UPI001425856A|nr:cyclic GMP-AMP synthase-like isoform X3 [Anneissia japonica]XP_033108692.1 cyclic GMP-AMP synthase-like isoform X3 [Anneissia japonica]XP_033108693.1 cyclic GMP-AMP synthase-like isoform X3 [Anneissia japonica]